MPVARDKSELSEITTPLGEERETDVFARRRRRRQQRVYRGAALLISFLAIVVLISPFPNPWSPRLTRGRPAPRDIVAPFAFQVVDREATDQRRLEARLSAPWVYSYEPEVLARAKQDFAQLKQTALAQSELVDAAEAPGTEARKALQARARELGLPEMSDATAGRLLSLATRRGFAEAVEDMLDEIYLGHGVTRGKYRYRAYHDRGLAVVDGLDRPIPPRQILDLADDLPYYVRSQAGAYFPRGTADGQKSAAALADVVLLLAQRPNVRLDERRRLEEVRRAEAAVRPVHKRLRAGQTIARAGETAEAEQVRIVNELRRLRLRRDLTRAGANAVFVLLALWFLIFYIRKFLPELGWQVSTLWLMLLPILIALAAGRLAIEIVPDPGRDVSPYLFPAAMVGLLGMMLLDARTGIVMIAIASLLFALAADMRFEFVIVAMMGGVAGLASLFSMRERRQFLLAGGFVALVNVVCIATVMFIFDPDGWSFGNVKARWAVAAGLFNGLLCIPLVYYLPLFFEQTFGVITDIRLLELTARHPLLLRLEREAPGTYQHSLNVAKLAEAAADAIGANFLLVRAGAYFHDIGKLTKREYFTENQVTPDETKIHARLTPHMSTLLIKNHVKEGVELARQNGLPPRVIDFIPQHHGTTLISYFYNLALRQYENSESKDPVEEDEFRYPGPRPQTPETAILMMADSVEATAHSVLTGRTVDTDDIRRIVQETVRTRFEDGQFDECRLTLRDLHLISLSFVHSLRARYHRRVDYRKAQKKEA